MLFEEGQRTPRPEYPRQIGAVHGHGEVGRSGREHELIGVKEQVARPSLMPTVRSGETDQTVCCGSTSTPRRANSCNSSRFESQR